MDGVHGQPDDQSPVDVGIVVALKEEFDELFKEIRTDYKALADAETGRVWYLFERPSTVASRNYHCIAAFVGDMGPVSAGLLTQALIKQWRPLSIVMPGIAAALSEDVQVGDVVVANQIDAYLENSKAFPSSDGKGYIFELGGEVYRSASNLFRAAQNFEYAHFSLFQDWQAYCASELQQILSNAGDKQALIARVVRDQAQMAYGHLASGPTVGAALAFKEWLGGRDRKYLALEMESAGLMAAVYERTDPQRTLILRAISDGGDERKKKLDKAGKGVLRRYAMRNAVNLLWKFLDAGILPFSAEKSSLHAEAPPIPPSLVQEVSPPKMSNQQRTKVFISFASADTSYLEEFQKQLALLVRKGTLDYWDTTKLVAGTVTKAEHQKALQAAKVAVLLVSADYLASETIYPDEIVPLLAAAQQEGVILKPVIIRPCLYEESEIGHLVPVNDPSKPISSMKAVEREGIWTTLALGVRDVLKS